MSSQAAWPILFNFVLRAADLQYFKEIHVKKNKIIHVLLRHFY